MSGISRQIPLFSLCAGWRPMRSQVLQAERAGAPSLDGAKKKPDRLGSGSLRIGRQKTINKKQWVDRYFPPRLGAIRGAKSFWCLWQHSMVLPRPTRYCHRPTSPSLRSTKPFAMPINTLAYNAGQGHHRWLHTLNLPTREAEANTDRNRFSPIHVPACEAAYDRYIPCDRRFLPGSQLFDLGAFQGCARNH